MYTIGIIGSKSSGKSTLANALAGEMFSRVAVIDGTSTAVTHNGRIRIIDFPPFSYFEGACTLSYKLADVDIVVLVIPASWVTGCPSIMRVFEDSVAARNRDGYYQMLIKVVGKYDFDDPEVDDLIKDPAVLRICGLKLVAELAAPAAAAHPAAAEWATREHAKAARFRGAQTVHERGIMALAAADEVVAAGRMCSVLKYISDNGVDNIPHICGLLKQCGGDPAVYMKKIAEQLVSRNIGAQYIYLRKYGEALGLGRLGYMRYLADSHLKCPVYAAENDRVRLAKYLYATDQFEPLPFSLEMQLPWAKTSYIWRTTYADICSNAGVSDVQDIIREIADSSLREYFQMGFYSYEELLADIVAGNYKSISACVTAAGVDWDNFRRRLSSDYFVHGRRGTVHMLICECASG